MPRPSASKSQVATIVGRGPFPIDMLRYDGCWPLQSQDAAIIQDATYGWTWTVRVVKNSPGGFTPARWASFNCTCADGDNANPFFQERRHPKPLIENFNPFDPKPNSGVWPSGDIPYEMIRTIHQTRAHIKVGQTELVCIYDEDGPLEGTVLRADNGHELDERLASGILEWLSHQPV